MAATLFAMLSSPALIAQDHQRYDANWNSLAHHTQAPEWFRDAKFGIYFHWGVYSVPAFATEWYPRHMHQEGKKVFNHHVENYGHPSEFGYHDFIPMFKAEHFDADEWARLFESAGARFAGPVAEHHDGFAMWDSDATPWNAVDMGPKRDITGEISAAIRKRGMKLITTFHHARNLQRCVKDPNQDPDKPHSCKFCFDSHFQAFEGMPTITEDPKLKLLYGRMEEGEWLDRMWLGKLHEVMDRYQPDMIWFDSWLNYIPEDYRERFCADYLNRAKDWNKEVVIIRKQQDLPLSVSVEDFEKGRADRLTEACWLTDDTISRGSWSYTEGLKIKPAREVIHNLIDIVSKNGCMLLNISPKADGSIPEKQRQVLLEIGEWLQVNGEAIYDTRPHSRYGDGPTELANGGHFVKEVAYTVQDIRYTRSKDDLTAYAIVLGVPEPGSVITMPSIPAKPKGVTLLGSDADLEWQHGKGGLQVTMPKKAPNPTALVFRIQRTFE